MEWGCRELTGERLPIIRKAVSVEWGCGELTGERLPIIRKAVRVEWGCGELTGERLPIIRKAVRVEWECGVLTGERLPIIRKAVSVDWGCGVGMWGTDRREVAHHQEGCECGVEQEGDAFRVTRVQHQTHARRICVQEKNTTNVIIMMTSMIFCFVPRQQFKIGEKKTEKRLA